MSCRLEALGFDIAASAGWYSAIAGLLAGFALLAILLPLDHDAEQSDDLLAGESVVIFTCAFFTLLILGFNYAILAGRTGDGPGAGVAAHEQLLNGAVFALASLLLLFGLRAVLNTYGRNAAVFAPAQNVMLGVTAVLGPIVALSLQFSNSLDLERVRIEQGGLSAVPCGPGGIPSGVWINLGVTVTAILAVLALAAVRDRLPRSLKAARIVAKSVLVLAVVVTVWTAVVVPLLPVSLVTGAPFEHVALVMTSIATVIVAAAANAAR
jgi:hypothetical protein